VLFGLQFVDHGLGIFSRLHQSRIARSKRRKVTFVIRMIGAWSCQQGILFRKKRGCNLHGFQSNLSSRALQVLDALREVLFVVIHCRNDPGANSVTRQCSPATTDARKSRTVSMTRMLPRKIHPGKALNRRPGVP